MKDSKLVVHFIDVRKPGTDLLLQPRKILSLVNLLGKVVTKNGYRPRSNGSGSARSASATETIGGAYETESISSNTTWSTESFAGSRTGYETGYKYGASLAAPLDP